MYGDISTDGNSCSALGVLNPTNNPIYFAATYPFSVNGGTDAYPYTSGGIDAPASWQIANVNLVPYVGHHVQVRFRFDSIDNTDNGFRGWFIDDVEVYTSTGTGPQVSSVPPNIGKAGDIVTISGSGFGMHQYNSTVTFNGVKALVSHS